eukprot:8844268-Alexandrium_andersonii.AAC.1
MIVYPLGHAMVHLSARLHMYYAPFACHVLYATTYPYFTTRPPPHPRHANPPPPQHHDLTRT